MAGSGGSSGFRGGVRPAPRAGAGPTVIAAGLVVLVIGLGWLNHSGDTGTGGTAFERDVANAVERAQAMGEIPGSDPASPSSVGSAGDGRDGDGGTGRTTSTTIVVDPETGLRITVNVLPDGSMSPSSTTGSTADGTTGTTSGSGTGGSGGSGGTTGTSRPGSTGTTNPPTTDPPTTDPPTTDPPTTDPPTTDPPTTEPPTTNPPTTDGGLLGDLIGGIAGALGL